VRSLEPARLIARPPGAAIGRVVVRARPCDSCGTRILLGRCFDGRWRSFDAAEFTDRQDAIGHRWWLKPYLGMVNEAVADQVPARWVRLHYCQPSNVVPVGALLLDLAQAATPNPLSPAHTAAMAAPGARYGYRWPTGPAHILKRPPGARTWCRAAAPYGATPREQARAAAMPVCADCLTAIDRRTTRPKDPG
jgi:hypothetical protein